MEDLQYRELIKSYDLDTLTNVENLIDREAFQNRYARIEAEIKQRQQGIGPEPAPEVSHFDLSRNENFAGFVYRLPALIIDLLVIYIPVTWLFSVLMDVNLWYAVAILPLFYPAYQVLLTLKGRQTVGKRLMGIVVVHQELFEPITLKQVLRRHSPDLLFAFGMVLSIAWLITQGFALNAQASIEANVSAFHYANSRWDQLDDLWDLWIWSEVIFLTFDDRRRGLHEWLSGTLVIHKSRQSNIDIKQNFKPSYYDWLTQIQHRLLHKA